MHKNINDKEKLRLGVPGSNSSAGLVCEGIGQSLAGFPVLMVLVPMKYPEVASFVYCTRWRPNYEQIMSFSY